MAVRRRGLLDWRLVVGGLALLAVGLGVTRLGPGLSQDAGELSGSIPEGGLPEVAPVMGALAPDFELMSLNGEGVKLSDLRGQPVLINFWATWCGPCRVEMPAIENRLEEYRGQGFEVLAVNFDEPAGAVEAFRDELGLTLTILLDPGSQVQKLYRNRSYPTSFFIDAQGVIQVQHIGVMTEGQLDDNLAAIGLRP